MMRILCGVNWTETCSMIMTAIEEVGPCTTQCSKISGTPEHPPRLCCCFMISATPATSLSLQGSLSCGERSGPTGASDETERTTPDGRPAPYLRATTQTRCFSFATSLVHWAVRSQSAGTVGNGRSFPLAQIRYLDSWVVFRSSSWNPNVSPCLALNTL